MWSDGVSEIDMLAYQPYAELVYEIATSERLTPLTIGLFGNWGSGKSTLLDLINKKINNNSDEEKKVISIKVNAWMYEGYDDAKVALMDSVIRTIMDEKEIKDKCEEGFKSLLKKVDWMRVGSTIVKKGTPLAVSALTGNPIPSLMSLIPNLDALNDLNDEKIEDYTSKLGKLKEFIKKNTENEQKNVVDNIRTFRNDFEQQLKDSAIDNLVIMVDDLDRCSPDRIVETLEAIKLFLSVENTTFIIAIDEDVVRYSVKRKYPKINDMEEIDISVDYIEKVVQFPIRIPELSEIDIKNYMLLLICERFLKKRFLEKLICGFKEKNIFTKGEIISITDIKSELTLEDIYKSNLKKQDFEKYLEIFNKIANIVSYVLKGNPRQTKRFLNTYFLRKRLSEIQNIKLNPAILAKLMVLEYTNKDLFKELYNWQFQNDGIAKELKDIYEIVTDDSDDNKEDRKSNYNSQWFDAKIKNWFTLEPDDIYNQDLRQYFYLAKESVAEKEFSVLNLGVEIRRKIKDICKDGLDDELREKKISQLKSENVNDRNEIIKSTINKFNQEKGNIKNVLLIVMKYYPEYIDEIIKQLKKLSKEDLDPGFLMKLNNFNKEPQKKSIEKLIKFYIENEIVTQEFVDRLNTI